IVLAAYSVENFGKLVKGAAGAVELTPTVIRNDDSGATNVDSLFCVFWTHDAFEAKFIVPVLDHFGNVTPIHRRVEHVCEVIPNSGGASRQRDVLLQLRQPKFFVGGVFDCP